MKNKRTIKKLRWRDMKPHTRRERKTMLRKYGSRCFLLPKELKYPICNKFTGNIECVGLSAAQSRAALSIYRKLKPKSIAYPVIPGPNAEPKTIVDVAKAFIEPKFLVP